MTRVLITGGTGFIGANLAARLADEGHEVHLAIRPGSDRWRVKALESRVQLHEANVRDHESITRLFEQVRPSWTFNLAAFGNSSWETDTLEIIDTTFKGAAHVFEAAARVDCQAIVQAGSSSEYGFGAAPTAEIDRLAPSSTYGVAKAAATLLGQQRARADGTPIVTLRFYSVYGPGEEPARLLPTLIVRGLDGEWPPLVHPSIARDFVHVNDAVEACLRAAGCAEALRGEVFNIGTGVQTTLADVAAHAQRLLPLRDDPPWGEMSPRVWDSSSWVADIRHAATQLGWSARTPFAEGFRDFVRWFEEEPSRRLRYKLPSQHR
jgi:nucleoside-diphosphate-sugar epimerase